MSGISLSQPDVTLLLDMGGIIREASVSSLLSGESVADWLGRPWGETVPQLASDKVRRIVEDARDTGISAFRQVNQRFPSGREVPIEYTTVLLGGRAGMISVGKSLQSVAELQSRLIAAQQTMERDYWKLREVETRYRLLFNSSSEAVLLIRASNFRIYEANPAAVRALGIAASTPEAAVGEDFLAALAAAEQPALSAMVQRVREQGKAPGTLVHLGKDRHPFLIRASLMKGEPGPLLLLQLVPTVPKPQTHLSDNLPSTEEMLRAVPDGFVVMDPQGVIRRANPAFSDMVDAGTVDAVIGEKLHRWIWRPGADVPALLSTLRQHGVVRLFPSALNGELGTETEVEISGARVPAGETQFYGVLLRDVGRRLSRYSDPNQINALIDSVASPVGKVPLRQLIKATIDGVERYYVKAALEQAGGNRTAASELLGLSRQSLYMKLNRYGLEDESQPEPEQEGGPPGGS
jgi:transcriptional regulator PpsR